MIYRSFNLILPLIFGTYSKFEVILDKGAGIVSLLWNW